MKFEETFDFDYSLETVMTMFTDENYFIAKYERMGTHKPELVNCEKKDDHFSVTVRHALDANRLSFPEIIQKRIGDRVMLRQTDAWDIPRRSGRIDIDIEKTPVNIAIDMRLTDDSGKARLKLAFDIDAQVPLLGSKIEKAIAGPITERFKRDMQISNKMAAEYASA